MNGQASLAYRNAQVEIKGDTMHWENRMIRISSITQLWTGSLQQDKPPLFPGLLLLFITLSGTHPETVVFMSVMLGISTAVWAYRYFTQKKVRGLHISVNTGDTFFFASDSDEFPDKVLGLMGDLFTNSGTASTLLLNFEGEGEMILSQEEIMEQEDAVENRMEGSALDAVKNPVAVELQELYLGYKEKEEADEEILGLIEEAALYAESNNREKMKESFKQLITAGLINDCNELGLSLLLDEIRASIY